MNHEQIMKKLAFINNSPYRQNTVKALQGSVKTPSEIGRENGIKTAHVSKILKELKTYELVECINEEVRKGRLYRLTPHGEEIAKQLK